MACSVLLIISFQFDVSPDVWGRFRPLLKMDSAGGSGSLSVRLLARENFIEFCCHETFKTYFVL
jgi:hypothetical protein